MTATTRIRLIRSTRIAIALFATSAVLGACTIIPFPDPPRHPSHHPPAARLLPLHAELDPVGGGSIVDADGREVLLRGVNVNALVDYWQYGQFPTTFPLTEGDAQHIADVGWNVVRLLVSWSRIEPEPGRYDEAYIEEVRAAVRLFERHGIRSIVDFHQDAWGPTLAARPGEACAAGQEPRSGGTARPPGRRSTTARRGARSPVSVSSVRRCGPRSPRSGPTDPDLAVWACGPGMPRWPDMSRDASRTSRQWPATTS